jgi:hypothetical protein
MGIEETAAVCFGESISCCAFPRWTVWFTSILAQSARTGAQKMGWIGRLQPGSNHTFGNLKLVIGEQ